MARRASVKAMTGQRTGRLLAVSVALLAGGCGASFPYSGLLQGGGAIPLASEGISAEPGAAPLSEITEGLVAARRRDEGEAIPGFEILIGFLMKDWSQIGNKPAGYWDSDGTPGPPYTFQSIPWSNAFDFSSGIAFQVVLKRPPRGAASLAAGDTFLIFGLSIDSYTGKNPTPTTPEDKFSDEDGNPSVTLTGYWIDGRTVLDPLGAGSGWRPYLQYGGGFIQFPKVFRTNSADTPSPNWSKSLVLGWHMAGGLEWRRGKLGVYIDYGVQAVGAPVTDGNATNKELHDAQDLVTYPVRIGVSLSF